MQWLSSRKIPRGGGGSSTQTFPTGTPGALLPVTKGDTLLAGSLCPTGTKEQEQPQRKSDSGEGPAMTKFSLTSLSISLLPRTGSWT